MQTPCLQGPSSTVRKHVPTIRAGDLSGVYHHPVYYINLVSDVRPSECGVLSEGVYLWRVSLGCVAEEFLKDVILECFSGV